jgi:peptidyl-prolyl cis-trans isomerase A (cyclophilin A)
MNRREVILGAAGLAAIAAVGVRAADAKPVVVLDTTLGEIHIQLEPEKAPVTTRNFLDYVKEKHYDGLVFHRVISTFMIQGGGLDADLKERKTRAPIKNESRNGLKNKRGTIAMARTSEPDSATSQFFINVKDNDSLDFPNPDGVGYAVFGTVVKGMDVVDKIKAVETGRKEGKLLVNGKEFTVPMDDVPVTPVVIKTARLQEPPK